jgi:hypothetical protein
MLYSHNSTVAAHVVKMAIGLSFYQPSVPCILREVCSLMNLVVVQDLWFCGCLRVPLESDPCVSKGGFERCAQRSHTPRQGKHDIHGLLVPRCNLSPLRHLSGRFL